MDQTEIRNVVEAALLAAARPLTLDQLLEIFAKRGGLEKAQVREALTALAEEYDSRGIQLAEVASGFRIQVRKGITDWLTPLWEERAPRYTRALLETLALIAYRQPITRGEIEEIRGVVVSTNIIRTLLERSWVRVVGHRDVPGKPAMFGTTREFLDYFGLKKLEELPPLSEIKDFADPNVTLQFPEEYPQQDIVETLAERDSANDPEAGDAGTDRAGGADEAERPVDADDGGVFAETDVAAAATDAATASDGVKHGDDTANVGDVAGAEATAGPDGGRAPAGDSAETTTTTTMATTKRNPSFCRSAWWTPAERTRAHPESTGGGRPRLTPRD